MWTDEVTDKYDHLIGAFRNFAKAPKNCGESDIYNAEILIGNA